MESLLYLSYKLTDISFSNLPTKYNHPLYYFIYDKVVNKTKLQIRNIMKNHQTKLILRTIYLLKSDGIMTVFNEMLNNPDNSTLSQWRLGMIYGVITFIVFETKDNRINNIIENMNIVLSLNNPNRNLVNNCIYKILHTDDPDDLNLYINAYIAFGPSLKIN